MKPEDMLNMPMAWQLTAGELRRALADTPEGAVVGLAVPAGAHIEPEVTTYLNLRVARASGFLFLLEPFVSNELTSDLFEAVRAGNPEDVARALDQGADVRSRDSTFGNDAQPPLIAAAVHGHHSVVALLISRGADVNARSASGWTALMRACDGGDSKCAKLLLDAGADPCLRNDEGYTAFGRIPGNLPALAELVASHGGQR